LKNDIEVPHQFLKELGLSRFVSFDLETTGLDDFCEIIEIGAVLYIDGEEAGRFAELVHPESSVPDNIVKLTGIDNRMLRNARSIREVLIDFLEFIEGAVIVAHNVNFDMGMLRRWTARCSLDLPAPITCVDTVPLSQVLLPTLANHRLSELAAYCEADLTNAHRAFDDAAATARVLLYLLRIGFGLKLTQIRQLVMLTAGTTDSMEVLFNSLLTWIKEQGSPQDALEFLPPFRNNLYRKVSMKTDSENNQDMIGGMRAWFGKDGHLKKAINEFQLRDQQLDLAEAVSQTMGLGEVSDTPFLLAEAATGTGKSFAYLLPAILKGRDLVAAEGKGVVLSTNTRNLQEQLFDKDIPLLGQLLQGSLKAVLLKGRSNYICGNRFARLIEEAPQRLSTLDRLKLLPLVLWMDGTNTGDIEECTGFHHNHNLALWSQLRSEALHCRSKQCRSVSRGSEPICYLNRIRREVNGAQLIVVNHSLLLADLEVEGYVLGDYKYLVIDEAHNLVRNAEKHLRKSFSFKLLNSLLRGIYDPDDSGKGLLKQIRAKVVDSEFVSESDRSQVIKALEALAETISEVSPLVTRYHKTLGDAQRDRHAENIRRTKFTQKHRLIKDQNPLRLHWELHRELYSKLPLLRNSVSDLDIVLQELPEEFALSGANLPGEFVALSSNLLEAFEMLDDLSSGESAEKTLKEIVEWVEVHPVSYESLFSSCPLDIGDELAIKLYSRLEGLVCCSATLTVADKFDHFIKSTGLAKIESKLRCECFGSPFNFDRQLRFMIPGWLPDSSYRNVDRFVTDLAGLVTRISEQYQRGCLILFTSYGLLNRCHSALMNQMDWRSTPLLAQGKDGARHEILAKFKEAGNAILLGTDSFWEGVDVPGEALQLLIMTKLPFDVPSEPMIEARMESITKSGRNPFMVHSVPEAVIRFRQGFGRLIRHEKDRGIFMLLDTRAVQKAYGESFIDSLPAKPTTYYREDDLLKAVSNFWRK
jgi:ATP-dependent DNA helicase DinG